MLQYNSPAATLSLIAAAVLALAAPHAAAASFTISNSSTTAQTLSAGQTGNVTATGSLTVSGSSVAVTVNGDNASLVNLGTISQTGTGRAVRDNTGVVGLVVTNGSATNSSALMKTADADVIQMNVAKGGVTLNNYGTMLSLNASAGGAQAVDFNAITASGSNTINNYATGVMKAFEADAVRPGVNGILNNAGSIIAVTTTGSSSDGVDFQANSGIQVNNTGNGSIVGGRHGITGGAASSSVSFLATISNDPGASISGSNGSGINLDGFNANQVITIQNRGLIVGNGVTGDGDGVDVDGLVNITNSGTIRSLNSFSAVAGSPGYSEGITVGGGTITNSGTIEGLVASGNTNAYGRGITLAGNDITSGPLTGTREGLYGNAVVTNQAGGLIRGQNDSAIVAEGAASGFTVTINNNAGATIRGGSATAAAIRTGLDNDTLTNSGVIDGSSSGKAIDLGGGNNTLNITGGQAVVVGDISGGVGGSNKLVIHPGAGNAFSYSGSITHFDSVEVQSGTVTLSGASGYTGVTRLSGGQLVLNGANRLAAASALVMAGGNLKLQGAGAGEGQRFASLSLENDGSIDLGGSGLTFDALGTIADGHVLNLFDYAVAVGYALRFQGDVTGSASFQHLLESLLIDGVHANYRFDGTFTDITPVPLPSSAWLMSLGLLGVAGAVRSRRRLVPAAA